MGPRTIAALERELTSLTGRPGAVMIAATDADPAGDKYAAHLAELAAASNVPAQRAVPAVHKDWNDSLVAAGQGPSPRLGLSPAVATIVRAMDRSDSAAPQPWWPAPIALGQRVRAFEEQPAPLRTTAAGPTARGADPAAERRPAPGPGAQP